MMRKFLVLLAALVLVACTPIGQIKDEDYVWQEARLPVSYQQAFRNIRAGFQRCPGDAIEGFLYDDTRTAQIDVYLATMFGDKGPSVHGRIFIDAIGPAEAKVRVGVTSVYDGPGLLGIGEKGGTRKKWLRWAGGDSRCQLDDPA